MPFITLTTEWNKNDIYVGAVKGVIYSNDINANVIDITHEVPSFDILRAAFILKHCYEFYPKGTVHIIGVRSESKEEHPYVVVEQGGQYFVGTDNGIFGLMFDQKPEKIIRIENTISSTFPERDIFAEVACKLINGTGIDELGEEQEKVFRQIPIIPTIDNGIIDGTVIYIDSYKNLVTNITKDIFDKEVNGCRFEILLENNYYKISKVNKHYHETAEGEMLAIFNSLGLLELAMYNGQLAEIMGIGLNATIRVKYYDN